MEHSSADEIFELCRNLQGICFSLVTCSIGECSVCYKQAGEEEQ
jgi:hypothetical protein